jgi:hypothetical protein
MAGEKEKQARESGARVAYLVCALFAFIAVLFGSIAVYLLLTTEGPQDIAGIFIGFVWVFLSVIVEILVIARAGLFRATNRRNPCRKMLRNEACFTVPAMKRARRLRPRSATRGCGSASPSSCSVPPFACSSSRSCSTAQGARQWRASPSHACR